MKKRQDVITILDYMPYKTDYLYPARIKELRIQPKRNQIMVTCRHIDADQEGRLFMTALPLPARPDNVTFQFLKACGLENLGPGTQIKVNTLVGFLIGLRFSTIEPSGTPASVSFENITLPSSHKKGLKDEVLLSKKTGHFSEKAESDHMPKS